MKRVVPLLLLFALLVVPAWANKRMAEVIFTGAATDTTAVGMADSSRVINTSGCDRLYLLLKPSVPCRVAIQIRVHGDSLAGSGTPALTDTTKTYIWPWGDANAASTADTLSYNPGTVTPTSVVPATNELTVTFPDDQTAATNKRWGCARGRVIALRGRDGEWLSAPCISIRFRVLAGVGVVTWNASIQGLSPQD